MLENMLSKEELEALLNEHNEDSARERLHADSRLESARQAEKDKLLHAVVRNQLRLLGMIDELQSEVRSLRSQLNAAVSGSGAYGEAAASAEPVPLPFMERKTELDPKSAPDKQQAAPSAQMSRKERFKRNSLWQ